VTEKTNGEKIDAIYASERPVMKYWAQITTLVIVAFYAAISYSDIGANQKAIEENKARIRAEDQEVREIKNKLTKFETKQEVIQEDVEEIKEDVKEILKELRSRS
jgi:septal ring factor EnvC (AmiA/AmiB activator)